jgi:hypothetical protein
MNTKMYAGPRPHYLKEITSFHYNQGSIMITGIGVFPATDPSLAERDHVNVAHGFFLEWNVGHLCAEEGHLYPILRITSLEAEYNYELKPGEEISFSLTILIHHRGENRMLGEAIMSGSTRGTIAFCSKIKFVSKKT